MGLSTLSPTPTVLLPPPRPLRLLLQRLLTLPQVALHMQDTPMDTPDGMEPTPMQALLLDTPMVPLPLPRPLRLLLQRLLAILMPTLGLPDSSATLMALLSPLSPQMLSQPVLHIWLPMPLFKRTN